MTQPLELTTIHQSPLTHIICGDCRHYVPPYEYDLVFADPPFNIGQTYDGYEDKLTAEDYQDFTFDWLSVATDCLRPGGTIAIHCPDDLVEIILTNHPKSLQRKDWIIWHYRFGQSGSAKKSTKCITSKAHLLVYVKGTTGQRTWNPPLVLSDRFTTYGDTRTLNSETPAQRVAGDVWGIPSDGPYWGRIQGNNGERWNIANGAAVDHPNQLPETYVKRAIESFSNPGDRILVPFGGSGTETVVAQALKRKVTTIEISETNCHSIVKRLQKGMVRK